MVSSGSFITTSCQKRSVTFSWSIKSQSVTNNTTTITWNLKGSGSYTGWVTCGGFKVVINGSIVYETNTNNRVNVRQDDEIASGTHTIQHNSDGTKTFSASVQAGIYNYDVNCKGSGSWTLVPIARASTISSLTSSVAINGSNAVTVDISRKSSKFTHTVRFYINNEYTQTYEKVATSQSYTIPTDWLGALDTSTSGKAYCTVTTYNGDTKVGSTVKKSFTITVPTSVKPKIGTITLKSDKGNTFLVQDKNTLTVSVSDCEPGDGSDIKSYTFSGPGLSKTTTSTSATTSSKISTTGELTYTVKVTDSRGRTASKTKTIQCYEWSAPKIKSFKAYRTNKDKVKDDNGTYITYSFDYTFASVGNNNSIKSTTAYYKESSETDYKPTTANPINLGTNGDKKTFNIYIQVQDSYGKSKSATITIFGASRIINISKDGKGLAVGAMSTTSNTFECGWDAKFNGSVSLSSPLLITSGGTGATTAHAAEYNILGKLPESTTATNGDTPIVCRYLEPSTGGVLYYKKASNIADYVRSKIALSDFTSGTLPVVRGGTGASTAKEAQYRLLEDMNSTDTAVSDDSKVVFKYTTGSTTKGSLLYKPMSFVWDYIASKMGSKSLYAGGLTSGSTTFAYGPYTAYVIKGQPSSSSDFVTITIPKSMIPTSDQAYQICDNQYWVGFKISYSADTNKVTLTYNGGSSGSAIRSVHGII